MNRISIAGMGPGNLEGMTKEALEAFEKADVIVGYTVYIDLLRKHFPQKQFVSTPMRQEIQRCRLCFEYALNGKNVVLTCSGDAGVYGMASPVFELQMETPEYRSVEIIIIAGVTAANSGAAVLGSPLNHDYCVISLSDLMTPWEQIKKRLIAAVQGDFALALYNPSSHVRRDYLQKACDIMLKAGAEKDRICGYVENIGREGTKATVCTLSELREKTVNMFTTVFVGNSQSVHFKSSSGDKIITKRGYKI